LIPAPLRPIVTFLCDVYARFSRHFGWAMASHVALSALLALFPFLIVVVAVASFFGTPASTEQAVALAFEGWPPGIAGPFSQEIVNVLTGRSGGLLTFGLIATLWVASSGVEALRVGLDLAYGVPDHRPWWKLRLQSILFVVVGAFGFVLLTIAVVLWPTLWDFALAHYRRLEEFSFVTNLVRYGLTGLFLMASLILFHLLLACGDRRILDVLPGIGLTLTLWLIAGWAFGVYLSNFATYTATYAGLGAVMAAIFFLYLNAVAFILGAELNAALFARGFGGDAKARADAKRAPIAAAAP
jgi:membrane protein